METLSSIQEKTADSHHEARKNEKSIYSLDWLIAPVKRAHPQVYDTLVPIWLRSFLQGKSFYKEKSFVSQTETICLETFPKQAQMMWNAVHAKNLSHTWYLSRTWYFDTQPTHIQYVSVPFLRPRRWTPSGPLRTWGAPLRSEHRNSTPASYQSPNTETQYWWREDNLKQRKKFDKIEALY